MSYQLQLQILRLNGWSDEKLSVELGEGLGSEGPSTQTIYRWRTGKTHPARVFRSALDRMFDQHQPKGAGSEDHEDKEQHQES